MGRARFPRQGESFRPTDYAVMGRREDGRASPAGSVKTFSISLLLVGLTYQAAPPNRVPAANQGSIRGVVQRLDEPRQPLIGAIVSLRSAALTIDKGAVTDENGRFSFTDVPDGQYTISATKAGYVT